MGAIAHPRAATHQHFVSGDGFSLKEVLKRYFVFFGGALADQHNPPRRYAEVEALGRYALHLQGE
jgi:hypothetical protein